MKSKHSPEVEGDLLVVEVDLREEEVVEGDLLVIEVVPSQVIELIASPLIGTI